MKKQFQILAATFMIVAFVSCSKEKIETPTTANEEMATTSSSSGARIVVDPLTVGLQGWFSFDANLKDKTQKLADGVPSTRVVKYGTDRKGKMKGALYLDDTYSVKLKSVPQQTNTSLSVWIKPYYLNSGGGGIVYNEVMGPKLGQGTNLLSCAVSTSVSTPGEYIEIFNTGWHHVVITFDGSYVKIYVNNVLKSSIPHSASIPASLVDYFVGWSSVWQYWKGYVDDLRFYSRTLSATDVQKLYNE